MEELSETRDIQLTILPSLVMYGLTGVKKPLLRNGLLLEPESQQLTISTFEKVLTDMY